jgi:hypothetical protein
LQIIFLIKGNFLRASPKSHCWVSSPCVTQTFARWLTDDLINSSRPYVPISFSPNHPATIRPMVFETPGHELSDAEVAAILRDIIAEAGRYPRPIELNFASICAEHLVDGLRLATLLVIRPAPSRLTE